MLTVGDCGSEADSSGEGDNGGGEGVTMAARVGDDNGGSDCTRATAAARAARCGKNSNGKGSSDMRAVEAARREGGGGGEARGRRRWRCRG